MPFASFICMIQKLSHHHAIQRLNDPGSHQELDLPHRHNDYRIIILGGGTGLRGTANPTAPGVQSPQQPPSQKSLRHQF